MLRPPGIEESDAASLKSTYLETISQALSGIAGAMGARGGPRSAVRGGEESATHVRSGDAAWAVLRIHLGAETASIAIGLEAALVAAIERPYNRRRRSRR